MNKETKFKVGAILEMTNRETDASITSVYIGKYNVLPFLSKKTLKTLQQEIINRVC